MPVLTPIKEVFAGVVGYDDETIVWDLDWNQTVAGVAPTLNTSGLPAGKCGVVFTLALGGGAQGTATLTATVNGVAVGTPLTATTYMAPA